MKLRIPLAVATIAVSVAATAVVTAGPAGAADVFEMVGWSGGSIVKAADNTVTSTITAASEVEGSSFQAQTNEAASLAVPDLISAGAVSTSAASFPVPGGVEVLSHVRTANVSLLGGAITIAAIDTTATAFDIAGVFGSDTSTTFVGIKIGSHKIPVNVPKNFQVNIPNVAQVVLNATFTATQTGNAVMTEGAGLYLSLLHPRGNNGNGAQVYLSPTYAALQLENPTLTHYVQGAAYGSQITAAVGTLANVKSDPTAPITLPGGGTQGVTNYNNIAAVNLNPVLKLGAIQTSATGTNNASLLDAHTTAEIAGINLFNGLITATALKADAHASGAPGGPYSSTGAGTFVNLTIDGKAISLNTSPNTVIYVLDLGTITINEILKTPNAVLVRVLDIKLSTAKYGLPVGAEVQLATASASVH